MESSDDELNGDAMTQLRIAGPSQHDCGYCKGTDTSISFGVWSEQMTCKDYQDLIDRGWRRSGKYLYKPDLQKSCCPQYTIRLDANEYHLTKGQKKVLSKFGRYISGDWSPDGKEDMMTDGTKKKSKKNPPKSFLDLVQDAEKPDQKHKLEIVLEPASFTQEKYELYKNYQINVHHDEPEEVSERGFKRFLCDSPLVRQVKNGVEFGSFHQKYLLNGKLFALSVIDILPHCVSAVYFMYHEDYAFLALGKYSVFREIYLTQTLSKSIPGLHWYYMGFYIHSCPKMNYKGQYAPSFLLDPVTYDWFRIEECRKELDKKPFVSFKTPDAMYTLKVPPGWLEPSQINDTDLESIYLMIDESTAAPFSAIINRVPKKYKAFLIDYVCSVGLDLASNILVS